MADETKAIDNIATTNPGAKILIVSHEAPAAKTSQRRTLDEATEKRASELSRKNYWIGHKGRYTQGFIDGVYGLVSKQLMTADQWNRLGDVSKSWLNQQPIIHLVAKTGKPIPQDISKVDLKDLDSKSIFLQSQGYWLGETPGEGVVDHLFELHSKDIITAVEWNKKGVASSVWEKQSKDITSRLEQPTAAHAAPSDETSKTKEEKKPEMPKLSEHKEEKKHPEKPAAEKEPSIKPVEEKKETPPSIPPSPKPEKEKPITSEPIFKAEEKADAPVLPKPSEKAAVLTPTLAPTPAPAAPEAPSAPPAPAPAAPPATITNVPPSETEKAKEGQDKATLEDDFVAYNPIIWEKRDGANVGEHPFDSCAFRPDHIAFKDGKLVLRLDDVKSHKRAYTSAEYRTNDFFSYGSVEASIKAAKGDGLVTTLFFYTGKWYGNPHDEIDVEIFGKDPTKMQVNYFAGSDAEHETVINLGFDASQEFHSYKIQWEKDRIVWYVDGKQVHSEDGSRSRGRLPSKPGKIMVSLWTCGSQKTGGDEGAIDWLNPFTYKEPVYAYYDNLRYTPLER